MRKTFILITILLLYFSVKSQHCTCLENFDFLVSKIENDYSGFGDKVNATTEKEYAMFTQSLRDKAGKTQSLYRCTLLLDAWLKFFDDKHLQIESTYNRYFTYKKIDSSAILLRIPSFSWEAKEIIDSLVKTNLSSITSTPVLILDLRGNGGGTDFAFQSLLPLIYTKPYVSKSVSWLASPGNIRIFEDALATGNVKKGQEEWTRNLVEEMKNHLNSFVNVDASDTVSEDTSYAMPVKVGVIVNDYCASSCEQFVLSAKNSDKTLVFGTNTLGVLDYSNAIKVDMPLKNLQLRYPISRSDRLPDFPIDNVGIAPDVRISLPDHLDLKDSVDDWVLFTKEYLMKELQK